MVFEVHLCIWKSVNMLEMISVLKTDQSDSETALE